MPITAYENNSVAACEALIGLKLPMRDAVAFYRAMDDTYWREGTDTYLEVKTTDGTVWEVAEVKIREVRTVPGSLLASRNVWCAYTLTLTDTDVTVGSDKRVLIHTVRTVDVYNDAVEYARVCAY